MKECTMTLKNDIHNRMIEAMKAKDSELKTIWATVLSSLQNAEKSGKHTHEFTDDETIDFLVGQIEQRRDSARQYADLNQKDKSDSELRESDLILDVLPERGAVLVELRRETSELIPQVVNKRTIGAVKKQLKAASNFHHGQHVVLNDGDLSIQ
jgi:uncharacterized protein YqeY